MKRICLTMTLAAMAALIFFSCVREDRFDTSMLDKETHTIFNITVASNTKSKSASKADQNFNTYFDAERVNAFIDPKVAFGIVGLDNETGEFLVRNQAVTENNGVRTANLMTSSLSSGSMSVSAFYPYTNNVNYRKDGTYAVEFTPNDIKLGPLATDAVDMRCDQRFETVDLKFHHIANSIGFKVCDITDDEQLRGLMHIRKLVLHGMPTEGLFVAGENCYWIPNAKRKDIVVFEGDDYVEYGEDKALFISMNNLSASKDECSRSYVIPEELAEGKHFVEVFFDVDSFTYDGFRYRSKTGASQIIPLSGVVPEDMFELGLQYTFVLGMNLGTVYRPIEFTATVQDWEAKFNARIIDFDNE